MQAVAGNKQERIIELEKQLAVAKAKVEQLDLRAKTMEREARVASQQAQMLRIKIGRGEDELEAVKSAPADDWEAGQRKLQVVWDDVQEHLGEVAARVRSALDG